MKRLVFLILLIAVVLIPIRTTISLTEITVGIDRAAASFWPDSVVKLWNDFCDSIGIDLPGCGSCGYC